MGEKINLEKGAKKQNKVLFIGIGQSLDWIATG